jgi:hypothetical protein
MSHPLLMALFRDRTTAAAAARHVHTLGVSREDLSVVACDHQTEGTIAEEVGGSPGSEIEDSRSVGHLGELGGFLLAAIAIGMPGTGALVAAGPLAAELGEAAGHAAGRLSSTFVKAGLSDKEAVDWQLRIHAGAVVLGVHARSIRPAVAEAALMSHGAERIIAAQWDDTQLRSE